MNLAKHLGRGVFNALAELGSVRMAPPRDSLARAHRLAGALGAIGRAHDIVATVRGDIPRGTALIVANHISYLDPIAILPVCPAIPIAKGEVAGWPLVGPIASALGVNFVTRADPMARVRALKRVYDLLGGGTPVLNFAEGTTTPGDRIQPFWRGTFGIAQLLDVPVVPLAVRYRDPSLAWCNDATFLPHYVRTCRRDNIEVELTFGAAMLPRAGEAPEAMAARARHRIAQLLGLGVSSMENSHATVRPRLSPSRSDAILPPARVA